MVEEAASTPMAQLVADHHEAVYRYAYRLTGSVPDAEDLTQQTFLIAQQKLGQLRNLESAQSWLFTILRNCFIRMWHRKRPKPVADLGLSVDTVPAAVPEEMEIEPQRLQEAIDQLPEASRMVVLMFYFEQRAYREIAEELDLPIGTVMSRLSRAKAFLRSKLFFPEGSEVSNHQPSAAR